MKCTSTYLWFYCSLIYCRSIEALVPRYIVICNHFLLFCYYLGKLLQEKLSHHLDQVEVSIAHQVAAKSHHFFQVKSLTLFRWDYGGQIIPPPYQLFHLLELHYFKLRIPISSFIRCSAPMGVLSALLYIQMIILF